MDSERPERWFSLLQAECDSQNGLFCFYDLEKSQRVAYCCGILSEHLEAFLDADWIEEKMDGDGQLSGDIK